MPVQETTAPATDILFQAFYWNTPQTSWWDTIDSKLPAWKNAGITGMWLPVISKAATGITSMGYDPFDYFDFGSYNQMGTTVTHFGSQADLFHLMADAKAQGFKMIADIVTNHCSGGAWQYSPFSKKAYYTSFIPASGKFPRSDSDFHISCVDSADEGTFGSFPDLCHNTPNVKNWLYLYPNSMARYYRDSLGFDGWRFDYTLGYEPAFVAAWNQNAPVTYSIGEYWDENVTNVNNWVLASGSGAFDFPLLYAMHSALDGGNMYMLQNAGLVTLNPTKAFTFVTNHDTSMISTAHKLQAYAMIMTSQGTPFMFYTDYNSLLDTAKLNKLMWIRKNLAAGSTTFLLASTTEYIFRRNGTPGVVTYLNIGATAAQETVQTTWPNRTLQDYTGANPTVTTDAMGNATITCQPNSYAVYSPQ